MNWSLKNIKSNNVGFGLLSLIYLFLLFPVFTSAQVSSSIDSTSIKIGEQITYAIQVETDTTNLVVFPEGQTFSPLEVIESFPIDTSKTNANQTLIKKYGLTQFDSGTFYIPKQKVLLLYLTHVLLP